MVLCAPCPRSEPPAASAPLLSAPFHPWVLGRGSPLSAPLAHTLPSPSSDWTSDLVPFFLPCALPSVPWSQFPCRQLCEELACDTGLRLENGVVSDPTSQSRCCHVGALPVLPITPARSNFQIPFIKLCNSRLCLLIPVWQKGWGNETHCTFFCSFPYLCLLKIIALLSHWNR